MPYTTVLLPLDEDEVPDKEKQDLLAAKERISLSLNDIYAEMKSHKDGFKPHCKLQSFAEFLEAMQMTEDQYKRALAFKLQQPKVLLKRAPNETLINNYNAVALTMWRANMDLQFILSPYAASSIIHHKIHD